MGAFCCSSIKNDSREGVSLPKGKLTVMFIKYYGDD